MENEQQINIYAGQKLQLKNDPSIFVEYTGRYIKRGKNIFINVILPNNTKKTILYNNVILVSEDANDAYAQIKKGLYGNMHDLKRLITFEKINRTLNDLIYSMEAANIYFYPHQFKPVIRFINSPAHRLILADEVGLGKTIEAGLIWLEMQARRGARRLLIVCPPTLQDKWAIELKNKFFIDAEKVDFKGLKNKVNNFQRYGDSENYVLISSYQALRPTKKDKEYLTEKKSQKDKILPSEKGEFYYELRDWNDIDYSPFDLVIFDEAHYMRNSETLAYLLGQSLCLAAQGVLCISATPIHNTSNDLFSLLTLIDNDFFSNSYGFDELIEKNEYIVNISNLISSHKINFDKIYYNISQIENKNFYINDSPLFDQLKKNIDNLCAQFSVSNNIDYDLLAQTQDITEKLNLLGRYVNRTCRREVEIDRAQRKVQVCTVHFNKLERRFYDSIEQNLRDQMYEYQQQSHNQLGGISLFTFFRIMGHQLQATSSLAAYAYRQIHGKLDESGAVWDFLGAYTPESYDLESEKYAEKNIVDLDLSEIASYQDLARNDSKFNMLLDILRKLGEERVVVFAAFHATLLYLRDRLEKLNFKVSLIYGKTNLSDRVNEVDRFIAGEVQILLSSEVGSEGIDLQCAHVVVNYDMPWNPMRVEQRIGRIDRVGQKSSVLHIINFNIDDTIEQRVYQKLHEKLSTATSVLGYMEEVIGKEMQTLAFDLFSQQLTEEEKDARIDHTVRVLTKKAALLKKLEEKSVALSGFSDYIQEKIKGNHANRQYISANELGDYLKDFFGRFFKGTMIQENVPAPGCLKITLTSEARQSLENFIAKERLNFRLRPAAITITFDRTALEKLSNRNRQLVEFVNHQSPYIRWITKYYMEHGHNFCRTASLKNYISDIPEGIYLFMVDLLEMSGIIKYNKLCYGIRNLNTGENLNQQLAQSIFSKIIINSDEWLEYDSIPTDFIINNKDILELYMNNFMLNEFEYFQSEHESICIIREKRINDFYDNKINNINETINKIKDNNKVLRMHEGRKKKIIEEKNNALDKLHNKLVDMSNSNIAIGIYINSPEFAK